MAATQTSNTACTFEVTAAPPSPDRTRERAGPARASLRGFLLLTRCQDNRLASGSEGQQLPEQLVGPRPQPSTAS